MKIQHYVILLLLFGAARVEGKPLPVKLNKTIENELIPAYLDRENETVLGMGTQIAQRISDVHLNALNEKLAESGIPSLGKLLLDARFELMTSNYQGRLPKPTQRELEMMLPAFETDIARVIKEVHESEFMKPQQPPTNFSQFEDLLWQIHVSKNQMMLVENMVQFGQALAHRNSKVTSQRRPKNANTTDDAPVEIDGETVKHFDELIGQVALLQKNIDERGIELRIDQLDLAINTLRENSTIKDKIKAAWVVDSDGNTLTEFVGNPAKMATLVSQRLKDPGLKDHIQLQLDAGTQLAGPEVLKKSQLFFTGLHWWLRGRYGEGPVGGGFLKRTAALTKPAEMFGLYMPRVKPKPTTPQDADYVNQVPEIDRRHHHIWRFEYRKLYSGGFSNTNTTQGPVTNKATSKTTLSKFY